MLCKSWKVRLAAVAGCIGALGGVARAEDSPQVEVRRLVIRGDGQGPQQVVVVQAEGGDEQAPCASSHWLGLECFRLETALRSHLGLSENEGLMIEQVVPDDQAAKAELKQYDVIVKAGEVKVSSLADLMKAVDAAKDQELALEVIRGGKQITMKAKPAARPESHDVLRRLPAASQERVRTWIEQFNRGEPGDQLRFRVLGPGAVLPGMDKNLPKGMSVSVTRSGSEPATITVKKGDQSWEVSEKELDKLPDDVRPHVERMLGRNILSLPGVPGVPGAPAVAPPQFRPEIRRFDGGTEKQLKEMMDQLERLRKQMDELQKSLPKESKPAANESRA